MRFSHFLDDVTCRVLSPAHLQLLGRKNSKVGKKQNKNSSKTHRCRRSNEPNDEERRRRWDEWVSSLRQRGKDAREQGQGHEVRKEEKFERRLILQEHEGTRNYSFRQKKERKDQRLGKKEGMKERRISFVYTL